MSMERVVSSGDREEEIAGLLVLLRETGQRLEALTGGEVDTATDAEGRILLFRGTSEQLEQEGVARQAAILNSLPGHIALLDTEGTILSVNDGWRLVTLMNSPSGSAETGPGVNYLEVCDRATGPGSQDAVFAANGIRSVLSGTTQRFEFDYKSDSPEEERWFQLTVTPFSKDRRKGVIVKHDNISRSKRDQSRLVLLAERLALATEVAKVGVWEWDIATSVLTWDRTMFDIYGFRETGSLSYEEWANAVHPEDLPEVEANLQRAINRGTDEKAEFRITAADGTLRYVSAAERGVVDHSGTVCRVIGVNYDVTERKNAEDELRRRQAAMTHMAEHDFLTNLPNQRLLRDRIQQAITMAARKSERVAILSLDVDGFKHINDSLGHAFGDKLLVSIAKRLVNAARASDTVSRFGGDEFVVLLTDVIHPEGISVTAVRMLETIATIHSIDQLELQVTASIGISVYPDDGVDTETLIKNADAAMYHAKKKGGSNYQYFHSDMNLRAVERQFIEQHLRRAIERNELALHYQPKYDLKTRRVQGVEALLRWTHPVRGPISPGTFIPIAEACGLIIPIGKWVLEQACRQAREWLDAGLPEISVAVNVSGRQFQSEGFEETVMELLDQFHMHPESLELEVTESLLMKSPELTVLLLQSLRRKGVRVALDDFGTGYSSLSYLRRFPVDTLKIDQSFVRQIDIPIGASIVKAIIHLGHELGMRIVAEGIETEREEKMLAEMTCDRGQGYYFSRPLPPATFATLLEGNVQSDATKSSI